MSWSKHHARVRRLKTMSLSALSRQLELGFSETSRRTIEAMGTGNPSNSFGFDLAKRALELIFSKVGQEKAIIKALAAIRWTDDRLWLIFKLFSLGYDTFNDPRQLGSVPRALFPVLLERARPGDGRDRLAALLVDAGVIDERFETDARPKLPRPLPLSVKEALELRKTWQLGPRDLVLGRPATPTSIRWLEKWLGRKLPAELRELLEACSSIGDREFGPPRWIAQITEEIRFGVEEDEEGDPGDPTDTRRGYHDVRRFDPLKSAIGLGTEISGDRFFLALRSKSDAGLPPVIRYHHDMSLTASVHARSLGEYVARLFARAWARREGLGLDLRRLEEEELKVTTPARKSRSGGRASSRG